MQHSMKCVTVETLFVVYMMCTTKQPNPWADEILNNPNLQLVDSRGRAVLSGG